MSEETKLPHNEACAVDTHNEHLCFLMYEGIQYSDKEAYKAIVQDAQFRCQNCGRTAKSAANLCDPVSL